MKVWESPFKSARSGAIIAGGVAVLVFLNSLGNEFAQDDFFILLGNQSLRDLQTLPGALLGPYWIGKYALGLGLWRPVVLGFFGLEWAFWGDIPVGYHALNVLLHGGVTVLVVLLLGGILPATAAFLGGLIFAVHPVHVEVVANVVGQAELLAAFFFLLACLLVQGVSPRMGSGRLALVLLCYALATLSKESAITLPGVILLLDSSKTDWGVRNLGEYLRKRWRLYGGLALVAGGVLMARFLVLGTVAKAYPPFGAQILEEIPRIWTVAATWPHLFRLLFFPLDLVVEYGPAVIPVFFGWNLENTLGAGLVLSTLVLSLLAWRRGPLSPQRLEGRAVGWGVVWFVITLSPTANIFFLSGILLSERTLYLPSVGFVAAAAWLLLALHRERPWVARGLVVVALSLLALRSWTRTPTWKNNLEVFHTLGEEHPESGRAQWALGDTYFAVGRMPEGYRAYSAAIGISRSHYGVILDLGTSMLTLGHFQAAEVLLSFAWEDRPEREVAPGLLATLYDNLGRYPEAEEAARASLAGDSAQGVQFHYLSRALAAQGRLEEARDARRRAIGNGEGEHWEQWGWLAELELALGDSGAARSAVDSARSYATSSQDHRQIDSVLVDLGFRTPVDSLPESARDSQNPRVPSQ
jgi:tetratricopeptide (TPR) repeat protein